MKNNWTIYVTVNVHNRIAMPIHVRYNKHVQEEDNLAPRHQLLLYYCITSESACDAIAPQQIDATAKM